MGYSTEKEVSALLRKEYVEETPDTEVTDAIVDADVLIDIRLNALESSLPLNPVPDAIGAASKYFAASAWLRLNQSSATAEFQARKFEKQANVFLETYIEKTYHQGAIRSG